MSIFNFFSKHIRKFFTFYFFIALFLIGLGYISILPIFENFDEDMHYSRIKEVLTDNGFLLNPSPYLDQEIFNYKGPLPYLSGDAPFDHQDSYKNFFENNRAIDIFVDQYVNKPSNSIFKASSIYNWQLQHPPLYYLILGSALKPTYFLSLSLKKQIFLLRLISYIFALLGVYMAFQSIKSSDYFRRHVTEVNLSFLLYPIIFPMFFSEFARVGNDSLCIFLTGAISFALSLWLKDFSNPKKYLMISALLVAGVFTKAFFIPISLTVLVFLTYSLRREFSIESQKKIIYLLILVYIPVFLAFSALYYSGGLIFGIEAEQLKNNGGLIKGLIEYFNYESFVHGAISPFVTFIWAGSWSLARIPSVMYFPVILGAIWISINYIKFILNAREKFEQHFLGVMLIIIFYFGLMWHNLIMIAIDGQTGVPGWYFHILMPWIVLLVTFGLINLFPSKLKRKILLAVTAYSFIFQLLAIWMHLTLFSGFAYKGSEKEFVFYCNYLCVGNFASIVDRLKIITFPYFGFLSFLLGFLIYLYLFKTSLRKKLN